MWRLRLPYHPVNYIPVTVLNLRSQTHKSTLSKHSGSLRTTKSHDCGFIKNGLSAANISSDIELRDQQNIIQNSNLIIIYATFLPCLCNDTMKQVYACFLTISFTRINRLFHIPLSPYKTESILRSRLLTSSDLLSPWGGLKICCRWSPDASLN